MTFRKDDRVGMIVQRIEGIAGEALNVSSVVKVGTVRWSWDYATLVEFDDGTNLWVRNDQLSLAPV